MNVNQRLYDSLTLIKVGCSITVYICLLGDGQGIRLAVDVVRGLGSAVLTLSPELGGYLGGGVTSWYQSIRFWEVRTCITVRSMMSL